MLIAVRRFVRLATFMALAAAVVVAAFARASDAARSRSDVQNPASIEQQPTQFQRPGRTLETVVLDPAHGGTDEGAHGAGGIVEKDIALALAQVVSARLAQDGLHVVMTRRNDETIGFDQRAAIANAQPNSIFLTLHVGSVGPAGSALAYYYDFKELRETPGTAPLGGLVPWGQAQQASSALSRRLASLIQVEMSQRLAGSPELTIGAPVYQLRAVEEPAVAVEIASVNAASANQLESLAAPLAEAISRAIRAFRTIYQTEAR